MKAIRKHRGLIVVDRQLIGSTSKKYDTIHALDIKNYYDSQQQSSSAMQQYRARENRGERVGQRSHSPRERSVGPAYDPRMQPAREGLITPPGPAPTTRSLRRSKRISDSLATVHLTSFNTDNNFAHIDPSKVVIPKNHGQAMRSQESEYWKEAEMVEVKAIFRADCVVEEELPKGAIIIDCKWVYDLKTNSMNQIVRFKARLSARGDQLAHLDLGNLFSPVVSWVGVRYFIALTVTLGLKPLQLDFDLAYLNADLEEVIYMRPPPGFEVAPGKAWRLKKSLYGLRQSGKNWNILLNGLLLSLNFKPFTEDPCLYIRRNPDKKIVTILFIYVDDVYMASNSDRVLERLPEKLRAHYPLKILGIPRQILGVEIRWGESFRSAHISIRKLIVSLLHQFGMLNAEPVETPMLPGLRFVKADNPDPKAIKQDREFKAMQGKYRTLVGTYIFICFTCRPEIIFAVNVLCRAMANPAYKHYDAAIYLLRYLSGTREAGITYRWNGNLKPIVYADSDDGADETRRSCAAFLIFFAGGPIIWGSKFIKEYALSSCESEIRAIAACQPSIKSSLYLQKVIRETVEAGLLDEENCMEADMRLSMPMVILEDNKAAIDWSNKSTSTQRMRHVERSLYWIRQFVANKAIILRHVKTEDQLADIGTKPLAVSAFKSLAQRIVTYYV